MRLCKESTLYQTPVFYRKTDKLFLFYQDGKSDDVRHCPSHVIGYICISYVRCV